jgi:hypothetical protein
MRRRRATFRSLPMSTWCRCCWRRRISTAACSQVGRPFLVIRDGRANVVRASVGHRETDRPLIVSAPLLIKRFA